jgi:hypothetical protein
MNEYEVRRGHQENIGPEKLKAHMQQIFGNVHEKDGKFVSSFGALKELNAWASAKNKLAIDTKMDTSVSNEIAHETIKAFNTFLERATGLTAKERGKRAQKAAKEGKT